MKKNVTKKIVYSAAATAVFAGSAVTGVGAIANADDDLKQFDKESIVGGEFLLEDRDYVQAYSAEPTPEDQLKYLKDHIHFGPQGAVNVQSVGKYRTQEGDQPDDSGVARLSWDVQYAAVMSDLFNGTSLTWVFVPKDLKNITVEYRPIDSDETIPLQLSENIPKVDADFGEYNIDIGIRENIFRFDAALADKEYLEMLQMTDDEAQNYQIIAIGELIWSQNSIHTVRISGDINVTGASSDVYVPLRATNRLATFSADDEHAIVGLSNYSWSDTGALPEFSIEDRDVNSRNAELYKKAENSIAGLAGAEKCRTTLNTDSGKNDGGAKVGEILHDLTGSKDDVLIPAEDWMRLRKDHQIVRSQVWINGPEDACDQSAHRILVDEKPEEEPTPSPSESPTPSPDPSPSESPTPSPSESPTPSPDPSPSESLTPSLSEEPTPEPSGTPKTDTPTPPVIPTPEPKGTEDVPTTTEKTTEPGARVIEKKTEPKPVPPVVNHTFPEKQLVPQNPSRVNTPPFVPAPAPAQPAAIPGPVSEHGPVVNTGGAIQDSFWTKIANLFR